MITVSYIAYLNSDGQISNLTSVPSGDLPVEGSTINELTVKHVTPSELEALNFTSTGGAFIDSYFWKNSAWVSKGARPNRYYYFNGSTEAWEKNSTEIINEVRQDRNTELGRSDWTQVADSPLSDEKKVEWRTYRQQLRDLMANLPSDLDNTDDVSWPTKPS
jgi:hypothetical protein